MLLSEHYSGVQYHSKLAFRVEFQVSGLLYQIRNNRRM